MMFFYWGNDFCGVYSMENIKYLRKTLTEEENFRIIIYFLKSTKYLQFKQHYKVWWWRRLLWELFQLRRGVKGPGTLLKQSSDCTSIITPPIRKQHNLRNRDIFLEKLCTGTAKTKPKQGHIILLFFRKKLFASVRSFSCEKKSSTEFRRAF
jgi:hypothetical protein